VSPGVAKYVGKEIIRKSAHDAHEDSPQYGHTACLRGLRLDKHGGQDQFGRIPEPSRGIRSGRARSRSG
jgi:hypothetical protein